MSERIKQINEVIKKELGKIILEEADLPRSIITTITRIDTSKDLRHAKVYISCFPEDKIEDILKQLNNNIYDMQQILNKRLHIRYVPKIAFKQDKELSKAQKVNELLEKIDL